MFYDESLKEVYSRLESSETGLTETEANIRLKKYGYNEFIQKNKHPILKIFFNQFKNFLILLLIGAALISLFVGEHLEFYGISAIILLTIVLGFIQEYRAEQAMDALEKISAPFATIFRDNKDEKIPARELVPGDMVHLTEGDIVPADVRLISSDGIEIDEASLTGESVPSRKTVEQLATGLPLSDHTNIAFSGTIVTKGNAKGMVFATGKNTEFGKIASSIDQMKDTATPLQIKFEKMAKQLTVIVLALVFVVFVVSIINMDSSDAGWTKLIAGLFIFSLSLAVAAVPSALAAIVTISLSRGAKRLASKNMIIKKLPAAESLGSVTIICSDKTGTLTKNQMTITKILSNDKVIDVTGSGYLPVGEFHEGDNNFVQKDIDSLGLLFKIGYLCNDSKLVNSLTESDISTKKENIIGGFTDDKWSIIGDPTEGSLLVLAKKGAMDEKIVEKKHTKIQELPFDSDRKLMSSIFKNSDTKKNEAYIKGAPDVVLTLCTKIYIKGKVRKLTQKDRNKILKYNDEFANDALRVLALAYRDVSTIKNYTISNVEKDLVFVGLVGMIDPPREGLKEALEQCNTAGIKVMMITGDHPVTATAIAKQIGLLKEGDRVLTGSQLEKLSEIELEQRIDNIRIIARALPIQKTRIVTALQKRGHVVAMTGDGVNDAPALKKADVGIAMGITGTDVSKEVAKAILADDNFATIVNAIAEGRNIYDRILKSTKYLLACNVGEVTTVFFAVLLRLPLPLITLQILLMNLLTDGLPALGLGSEPAEDDVMKRSPRNPKHNPLTREMLTLIAIFGIAMGIGTLIAFSFYYKTDLKLAQTVAFTTIVMFEMFAVMSARSFASFSKISPFSNKWLSLGIAASVGIQLLVIYTPFLQKFFGTVPLGWTHWAVILGISSLGFVMMEISKLLVKEKYSDSKNSTTSLPAQ
ncbi:MAG: cation-translocating P-type ATPase [Candidatus Woesearchaeota archaeon]